MKLVRDKIPELYHAGQLEPREGEREYAFRKATHEEYLLLLRLKLAEEIGEVLSAPTKAQLMLELGDVMDVAMELQDAEGILESDVKAQAAKRVRLGGFREGWVLE